MKKCTCCQHVFSSRKQECPICGCENNLEFDPFNNPVMDNDPFNDAFDNDFETLDEREEVIYAAYSQRKRNGFQD